MNISNFGKTMGNLTKRINVRLVDNAGDYKKCIRKPSFVSQKIFSKNIVAILETKPVLTLDKPVCVRFSIIDLSKIMFKFHYKFIKRKYNDKLLFADTDSLVYDIKTEYVYEDFYKIKICLILVIIHELFDPANKKVMGTMKDRWKGKIINESVGLKTKIFSLVSVDGKENKKTKGVNKMLLKALDIGNLLLFCLAEK